MQQMIQDFETILRRYGGDQINGIDAAMKFLAGTYSMDAASAICPYISKRLGIAEWIVRMDMMQRYAQIEKRKSK